MKKEIKNVHSELITLFVKRGDEEIRVDIPPGHSMIVDDYETPTIRIFKKKGLITMETAQLMQSSSFSWLGDSESPISDAKDISKTMDETVDPNNDEVMDHFHTTETHEVSFKGEPTRLEIIEGEVVQYVESGYVKGEWSDEDIEFLKKNYPSKGRKYCSTHLNRNESSVQKKINSLGLKKKKKRKR